MMTFDSSLQYRLPERLRMHPAQAITLQASANIQGTRDLLPLTALDITDTWYGSRAADLFEVCTARPT